MHANHMKSIHFRFRDIWDCTQFLDLLKQISKACVWVSVWTNASKVGVTCDILKHFQECISNLRNNIIIILFCCFTFSVSSRQQFLFLFIKCRAEWETSINWVNIFHDEYKTFSLNNGFDCLGRYSWNFWTKNNNQAWALPSVWLENSLHLELSSFWPKICKFR